MALTDIVSGTDGDVTASGFNAEIDAWTFDLSADSVSYRTFTSAWKKQKNVAYGATGQFTGTIQFDAASTSPMPTATGGEVNTPSFEGVSFTLTATTGCTYTFTGNVTGIGLNRTATDRMTGTFRFNTDGAVTQTWDETGS